MSRRTSASNSNIEEFPYAIPTPNTRTAISAIARRSKGLFPGAAGGFGADMRSEMLSAMAAWA